MSGDKDDDISISNDSSSNGNHKKHDNKNGNKQRRSNKNRYCTYARKLQTISDVHAENLLGRPVPELLEIPIRSDPRRKKSKAKHVEEQILRDAQPLKLLCENPDAKSGADYERLLRPCDVPSSKEARNSYDLPRHYPNTRDPRRFENCLRRAHTKDLIKPSLVDNDVVPVTPTYPPILVVDQSDWPSSVSFAIEQVKPEECLVELVKGEPKTSKVLDAVTRWPEQDQPCEESEDSSIEEMSELPRQRPFNEDEQFQESMIDDMRIEFSNTVEVGASGAWRRSSDEDEEIIRPGPSRESGHRHRQRHRPHQRHERAAANAPAKEIIEIVDLCEDDDEEKKDVKPKPEMTQDGADGANYQPEDGEIEQTLGRHSIDYRLKRLLIRECPDVITLDDDDDDDEVQEAAYISDVIRNLAANEEEHQRSEPVSEPTAIVTETESEKQFASPTIKVRQLSELANPSLKHDLATTSSDNESGQRGVAFQVDESIDNSKSTSTARTPDALLSLDDEPLTVGISESLLIRRSEDSNDSGVELPLQPCASPWQQRLDTEEAVILEPLDKSKNSSCRSSFQAGATAAEKICDKNEVRDDCSTMHLQTRAERECEKVEAESAMQTENAGDGSSDDATVARRENEKENKNDQIACEKVANDCDISRQNFLLVSKLLTKSNDSNIAVDAEKIIDDLPNNDSNDLKTQNLQTDVVNSKSSEELISIGNSERSLEEADVTAKSIEVECNRPKDNAEESANSFVNESSNALDQQVAIDDSPCKDNDRVDSRDELMIDELAEDDISTLAAKLADEEEKNLREKELESEQRYKKLQLALRPTLGSYTLSSEQFAMINWMNENIEILPKVAAAAVEASRGSRKRTTDSQALLVSPAPAAKRRKSDIGSATFTTDLLRSRVAVYSNCSTSALLRHVADNPVQFLPTLVQLMRSFVYARISLCVFASHDPCLTIFKFMEIHHRTMRSQLFWDDRNEYWHQITQPRRSSVSITEVLDADTSINTETTQSSSNSNDAGIKLSNIFPKEKNLYAIEPKKAKREFTGLEFINNPAPCKVRSNTYKSWQLLDLKPNTQVRTNSLHEHSNITRWKRISNKNKPKLPPQIQPSKFDPVEKEVPELEDEFLNKPIHKTDYNLSMSPLVKQLVKKPGKRQSSSEVENESIHKRTKMSSEMAIPLESETWGKNIHDSLIEEITPNERFYGHHFTPCPTPFHDPDSSLYGDDFRNYAPDFNNSDSENEFLSRDEERSLVIAEVDMDQPTMEDDSSTVHQEEEVVPTNDSHSKELEGLVDPNQNIVVSQDKRSLVTAEVDMDQPTMEDGRSTVHQEEEVVPINDSHNKVLEDLVDPNQNIVVSKNERSLATAEVDMDQPTMEDDRNTVHQEEEVLPANESHSKELEGLVDPNQNIVVSKNEKSLATAEVDMDQPTMEDDRNTIHQEEEVVPANESHSKVLEGLVDPNQNIVIENNITTQEESEQSKESNEHNHESIDDCSDEFQEGSINNIDNDDLLVLSSTSTDNDDDFEQDKSEFGKWIENCEKNESSKDCNSDFSEKENLKECSGNFTENNSDILQEQDNISTETSADNGEISSGSDNGKTVEDEPTKKEQSASRRLLTIEEMMNSFDVDAVMPSIKCKDDNLTKSPSNSNKTKKPLNRDWPRRSKKTSQESSLAGDCNSEKIETGLITQASEESLENTHVQEPEESFQKSSDDSAPQQSQEFFNDSAPQQSQESFDNLAPQESLGNSAPQQSQESLDDLILQLSHELNDDSIVQPLQESVDSSLPPSQESIDDSSLQPSEELSKDITTCQPVEKKSAEKNLFEPLKFVFSKIQNSDVEGFTMKRKSSCSSETSSNSDTSISSKESSSVSKKRRKSHKKRRLSSPISKDPVNDESPRQETPLDNSEEPAETNSEIHDFVNDAANECAENLADHSREEEDLLKEVENNQALVSSEQVSSIAADNQEITESQSDVLKDFDAGLENLTGCEEREEHDLPAESGDDGNQMVPDIDDNNFEGGDFEFLEMCMNSDSGSDDERFSVDNEVDKRSFVAEESRIILPEPEQVEADPCTENGEGEQITADEDTQKQDGDSSRVEDQNQRDSLQADSLTEDPSQRDSLQTNSHTENTSQRDSLQANFAAEHKEAEEDSDDDIIFICHTKSDSTVTHNRIIKTEAEYDVGSRSEIEHTTAREAVVPSSPESTAKCVAEPTEKEAVLDTSQEKVATRTTLTQGDVMLNIIEEAISRSISTDDNGDSETLPPQEQREDSSVNDNVASSVEKSPDVTTDLHIDQTNVGDNNNSNNDSDSSQVPNPVATSTLQEDSNNLNNAETWKSLNVFPSFIAPEENRNDFVEQNVRFLEEQEVLERSLAVFKDVTAKSVADSTTDEFVRTCDEVTTKPNNSKLVNELKEYGIEVVDDIDSPTVFTPPAESNATRAPFRLRNINEMLRKPSAPPVESQNPASSNNVIQSNIVYDPLQGTFESGPSSNVVGQLLVPNNTLVRPSNVQPMIVPQNYTNFSNAQIIPTNNRFVPSSVAVNVPIGHHNNPSVPLQQINQPQGVRFAPVWYQSPIQSIIKASDLYSNEFNVNSLPTNSNTTSHNVQANIDSRSANKTQSKPKYKDVFALPHVPYERLYFLPEPCKIQVTDNEDVKKTKLVIYRGELYNRIKDIIRFMQRIKDKLDSIIEDFIQYRTLTEEHWEFQNSLKTFFQCYNVFISLIEEKSRNFVKKVMINSLKKDNLPYIRDPKKNSFQELEEMFEKMPKTHFNITENTKPFLQALEGLYLKIKRKNNNNNNDVTMSQADKAHFYLQVNLYKMILSLNGVISPG